jgi:small-conductance mechanosensitive channel
VAIGFAAQTSMSNLISGLFLLSENFLSIGDTISAGSVYGEIESIDLFSVKVRTNDGMLVRIPNEQLIKNDLVNVTFYPSRRVEIAIGVPANESLDRLISMVNNVIAQNKFVISNPSPVIVINSLSSNAQHITLRVWSEHKNILTMKTTLVEQLNDHLISEGIKTLFVSAR